MNREWHLKKCGRMTWRRACVQVGDFGHCSNCYAHLGGGLAFDLHVAGYSLKDVAGYIHGEMEVAVHASLSSEGPTQTGGVDGSTDLGKVDIPTVTFFIGPVPFAIQTVRAVLAECDDG